MASYFFYLTNNIRLSVLVGRTEIRVHLSPLQTTRESNAVKIVTHHPPRSFYLLLPPVPNAIYSPSPPVSQSARLSIGGPAP